jgi:hypothetical protein
MITRYVPLFPNGINTWKFRGPLIVTSSHGRSPICRVFRSLFISCSADSCCYRVSCQMIDEFCTEHRRYIGLSYITSATFRKSSDRYVAFNSLSMVTSYVLRGSGWRIIRGNLHSLVFKVKRARLRRKLEAIIGRRVSLIQKHFDNYTLRRSPASWKFLPRLQDL